MDRAKGKGSLKHRIYQRLLADHLRKQGKFAVVEGFIGKNVDVLAIDGGKTIAMEIQLTLKHCLQVEKDFQLGCDEVWVVCETEDVLGSIERTIRKELPKSWCDKIKFFLVREILPLAGIENGRDTAGYDPTAVDRNGNHKTRGGDVRCREKASQ